MDLKYSNFRVWETIEEIAKFIKKVDPKHPTMTVIAGLDPAKVFMIKKYCPSIDILGINVYGAIENDPINITNAPKRPETAYLSRPGDPRKNSEN